MKLTKTAAAAVVGVAAASVLSGGAVAVATHDGNTLHACSANRGGALRLVTAATDCSKSERPVSWNVEGPAGPPGSLNLQFATARNVLEDGANISTVACPTGTWPIASTHTISEGPGVVRDVDGIGDETTTAYYYITGIADDPTTETAVPTLSVTLTCRPQS